MDRHLHTVSDEEKYYFDLRGYLVVRNALTAEEVEACNRAIDHFAAGITHYQGSLARGSAALEGKTSRQQLSGKLRCRLKMIRWRSGAPQIAPSQDLAASQRDFKTIAKTGAKKWMRKNATSEI